MKCDEMISETITGFDLQEPAVAYLESPLDTELFLGNLDAFDYVADGNYRLSRRHGCIALYVGSHTVCTDELATTYANLLGPWKPVPKYYRFLPQTRDTWMEAQRAHWLDACDKAIQLSHLPYEDLVTALKNWNARHPLNPMGMRHIVAAKRKAEHILYGSDDERDGETATGRNRPCKLASFA